MIKIELATEPLAQDLETISQGIQAFNRQVVPPIPDVSEELRFAVFARDADGHVVGGIRAAAYWGYLCIELLWLAESVRGEGAGRRLMEQAEAFAARKGFRYARVETTSFQARPFYEKLGYTLFGELEDCPLGHTTYYLRKQLVR
ncbi:MAG TPA: GNAT family N-acetyltransferase [Oleiagrimonas sp.]|nr:GNAT family N-acetyltransferase [Oleiagrimonas sp.]